MNDNLKYTQAVYRAFVDVHGNYKLDVTTPIGKRNLDDRSVTFLSNYVRLVVNSNILSKTSKIYINSIENEPMDAIVAHNALVNELAQVGKKKASNAFYNDRKKLNNIFVEDMLYRIIYKKDPDMDAYEAMLKTAIANVTGKSLLGKVTTLALPNIISTERPTDAELEDFITMIELYSPKTIAIAEGMAPKEVVGYINYIATLSSPSAEDALILERIKNI